MTNQTLELQAVTNEELQAAAGGLGPHFTNKNSVNDDHGLQSLGWRPTLMERLRPIGPRR